MKSIVMSLLLICFLNAGLSSQPAFNELSGSYGLASTYSLMYSGWIDPLITAFSLGILTSETTNVKVTGPVIISWKHVPKSRWGFGILTGYLKGSNDEITGAVWSDNQTINHRKYSALTISPEIDFRYVRKEEFTMYSSVAAGLTFFSEEIDRSSEKNTHGDFHLSLIGLRYGKNIGAFAELGFGFKGLLNFGINLRL
jgi:hypothetical protein